jgi:LysM repeat protein
MPAAPADPAQGGDAIGQAAAGGAPSPGGSGATSGANAVDVAQPTAQTQPAAPAAPAGGQYVIKPGDNLTKIAKANGTTIKDIMAVNPQIKDPNKIMAGAKLNLPGKAAAPAAAAPQKSDAAKLAAGEAPVEETLSLIKKLAGLR